MPDATITSTASTFGTITGTFSADQSTITGTITGTVVGTLTGSVGVPGPAGPAGIGLPAGGTSGQFLQKTSGADYATDWVTVNLTSYAVKANNLSDLTSIPTARDNLGLGSLNTPTFAGVQIQGAGSNVANLGATFLTLSQPGYGMFTIQPSQGIVFPDATVQTTAFTGLTGYAPINSPVFTGDPRGPTPAFGDNDTSLATTAFVQAALAGGTAVARNLEVEVRNQSGSTIPAGSIVYISGATGNKPLITLAQANNDTNSAQTIGFVKTSIANNGTGFVIVRGELENIDTSALTEGVQLYLSPTTAGAWTTTKPSAPQHLVYVGIVVRSHPTLGTILVAVQNGYELDELHDVAIASKANNDLLAYESSTNLWKNKTFSALGLLTSSALTGYATESWVTAGFYPLTGNPSGFITSAALSTYAPLASPALTGNVTITSNSTGAALFIQQAGSGNILTLHDQASDTTFVAIDQDGKVNTIASTTVNAGFNIPHGTAPTTPTNGDVWSTTSGLFWRQNGSTKQAMNLGDNQSVSGIITFTNASLTVGNSTASSTIVIGSGATVSGSFKTIQIGMNGAAGSTTNITIGSTTGTSTTTLQGNTNGVTQSAGNSTTLLATTAFVTTADNLKANLASPTFTGTPAAPTAAVDTNTTQLATTAYVVGQGYLKSATASTTYAPLASPALTGTPTAPTATAGTNTTQLATTAFVQQEVPAASTTAAGKVELATLAEVVTGTSTSLVSPLSQIPSILTRPELRSLVILNATALTGSGGVSSGNAAFGIREMYLASLATGRAAYNYGIPGFANAQPNMSRADWSKIDFSKKIWMSGKSMCGATISGTNYIGDSNTFTRVTLGGYNAQAVTGDMTLMGIGWKKQGGTSPFFTLTVHNGTTLTDVASTITQSAGKAIDWVIYSDGTGNVTLYIDGAQVATTTAGPTGISNAGAASYREQVEAATTPTVRQVLEAVGGWLYIEG